MCDKWEREWERYDNMGGFTMAECCEKADKADPDHGLQALKSLTALQALGSLRSIVAPALQAL